VIIQGFSAA